MVQSQINTDVLVLLGGRLSLDFANTVDWHASENPTEFLNSYADLVSWSVHVGILTEQVAGQLLEEAVGSPSEASAVLHRAIELREAIYRILSAITHGLKPQPDDLAALTDDVSWALGMARLAWTGEGFVWQWTGDPHALDRMLWAVIHDAADLLTSEDLERVGQCADLRCGWLFVDKSRNQSRRWCSMAYCGNRAKARRHYRRSRGRADSSP